MALRKCKVVEQIVHTVGGGEKSPEGLDASALWIGKWLAETNCSEFTTRSSRAGVRVVMDQISPEATAATWHDALVTKTKQRKSDTSSVGLVDQSLRKKRTLMHWRAKRTS
jgi:hypothetical protein